MFAELEQKVLGGVSRLIKKAVLTAVFGGVGIGFLLVALSFFSFAGYMWLIATHSRTEAALIVGGALTGCAIIFILIGIIIMKAGSGKTPAAAAQPAPAPSIPHIRTGFPLVDLAQIAIPLAMPFREHVTARIKSQPISSAALAMAGGVIAGFFLLTRRSPKERGKR